MVANYNAHFRSSRRDSKASNKAGRLIEQLRILYIKERTASIRLHSSSCIAGGRAACEYNRSANQRARSYARGRGGYWLRPLTLIEIVPSLRAERVAESQRGHVTSLCFPRAYFLYPKG